MRVHEPTSAIVIAGGRSSRLGRDKRRLRLWGADGPLLLEHTIGIVAQFCPDVVVVLNDGEEWADLPARVVPDAFPDSGPLAGIYSGLLAAQHDYALAVAADMPFLSPALLGAMLARERDYDVLAPHSLRAGAARNQLDLEPLHAVYRKTCLEPMRAALQSGRRQIAAFFPEVRVAYVEPDAVLRYDPSGRALENINTPEQLAAAEQLLRG